MRGDHLVHHLGKIDGSEPFASRLKNPSASLVGSSRLSGLADGRPPIRISRVGPRYGTISRDRIFDRAMLNVPADRVTAAVRREPFIRSKSLSFSGNVYGNSKRNAVAARIMRSRDPSSFIHANDACLACNRVPRRKRADLMAT